MVGLGRFELPTSRLSGARSYLLSYRPNTVRPVCGLFILRTASNSDPADECASISFITCAAILITGIDLGLYLTVTP